MTQSTVGPGSKREPSASRLVGTKKEALETDPKS